MDNTAPRGGTLKALRQGKEASREWPRAVQLGSQEKSRTGKCLPEHTLLGLFSAIWAVGTEGRARPPAQLPGQSKHQRHV